MIRTTSTIISKKLITTTRKVSSDVEKFDTVIIGAGVIGLAVAHAIVQSLLTSSSSSSLSKSSFLQRQSPHEIVIIDRGYTIGTETSSRNSEVIHGGLYYPNTSLKGQLCVYGKKLIYKYCQQEKKNVPIKQCGKLIVANTIEQYNQLQDIQKQAILNGVYDTKILSSQQQVNELEPAITAQYGALYSPSTGIIDSHAFMEQLVYDILNPTIQQQNEHNNNNSIVNTTLALRTKVIDGFISTTTNNTNDNDPYHIYVCTQDTSDSNDTSTMWLKCRQLINCSGLWSTFIANMFHNTNKNHNHIYSSNHISNNHWQPPQQYFCRGTYYKLQCNKENHPNFQHLIYPLPTNDYSGLGIHATIDITGENIKFGPNVDWVPIHITNPDDIDLTPDRNCMDQFYNSIATYYPTILNNHNMTLIPDYVGIRPKLIHPSLFNNNTDQQQHHKLPFQDFQIIGPNIHHIPGLIHLFGIESPGLTSSMAIGQYIVQMLNESKK